MMYLANRGEAQEIDRATIEDRGIPGILLMERAAISVLTEINKRFHSDSSENRPCRVLITVEGGNNGGDGLALARLLSQQGDMVDVYYIDGISSASVSFNYQLDIVKKLGINISNRIPDDDYDIIVDAVFGVGLKREIQGVWRDAIEIMNDRPGYKIAVDLPSGVDATTGQILGTAFAADLTVTFGLNKRGLVLHPGCDMAGNVVVCDIGFAESEIEKTGIESYTYDLTDLRKLPERMASSNKGTYGRVAVIAGSRDMSGAMTLAAEAVYRMGAGLVKVYTHENNRIIAGIRVPEAVLMTYSDADEAETCAMDAVSWSDVILIGPGIGRSEAARRMVKHVVRSAHQPLVMDADALNVISDNRELLRCHRHDVVVTPHIGEMSRLTDISIPDIKKNILEVCKDFAREYNVIDVLKDARTCVSAGDRDVYINTSGNDGMSTAGSGDVLAGIISGLIGMGMGTYDAARLGVYIHGLAGDTAAHTKGRNGMLARDMVEAIPDVIKGA